MTISAVRSFGCLALIGILAGCTLTNAKGRVGNSGLASSQPVEALAFQADEQFAKGLSKSDRKNLSQAERKALDFGEAGSPILWKGNNDKVSGTVTVFSPFRVGKSNCRRFAHKVSDGDKSRNVTGTACQRNGGGWKLVV